jgi:hypothetical protein
VKKYQAPAITGHRTIEGQLADGRSYRPESDAEIKHGIEAVAGSEAPMISEAN